MSESIKVDEDDKERLEELKEGLTEYGESSYGDAVRFLLDYYDGNVEEGVEDSSASGNSGVTRRSADGNSAGNGNTSKEVEDKVNSVRIEDNGGTRNNDNVGDAEDGESFQDEDTESLSADELQSRVQR